MRASRGKRYRQDIPGEQTGAAVIAAAAGEKLFSLHRGSNSEGMRGRCTPCTSAPLRPADGKVRERLLDAQLPKLLGRFPNVV